MSRNETVNITCPKCQEEHPFEIWDSINVTLEPEMKPLVQDRSVFIFECPNCGAKVNVDYPLLYHQMDDQILIQYATTEQEAEDFYQIVSGQQNVGMPNSFADQNYLTRIVFSQFALLEKIMIFDEGLDDRIVEIYKLFVRSSFRNEHPDCDAIEAYFYHNEGKNYIQILVDGKPQGAAEMAKEMYYKIAEDFADELPDLRKDEPVIDSQWAVEAFNKHNKS